MVHQIQARTSTFEGAVPTDISITNGVAGIAVSISTPRTRKSVVLDPEMAVEFAKALLNAADNVEQKIHGNTPEAQYTDTLTAIRQLTKEV